jgi:uncharacterized membrane protein
VEFAQTIELVGQGVDVAGVAVIIVGVMIATARFATLGVRAGNWGEAYQDYRKGLGRGLLLGLEFLVAADIIRTVAIRPTFESVGVLAIIVLIRTFLSWTLELELDGRWPWQRERVEADSGK